MIYTKIKSLLFVVLFFSSLLALHGTSAAAVSKQVVHGYVVAGTIKGAELVRALPDTTILDLQIGLSIRNAERLDSLIENIYNPASPNFRHYPSSDGFTEIFCPTEDNYRTIINFMEAHGFTVTGRYSNRVVLDVRGSAAVIEKTFHAAINVYQHPTEHRTFYAPNVAATVDSLDVPISDVIGLDNFAPPRPMGLRKPKPGEKVETTGSGPGGLFIGKDYRAAYAPGVSLDGTGQVVGLFEFGPYWPNDIAAYENQAGLPHPKISNVLLDGFSGVPGSTEDVGEESLDIENAIAMAPGAAFIVYEGNSAVDILSRIASDNKAKQISCSFGWYPASSTENNLYKQLVSQGQDFFVASGDGGAYADTVQIFSPTDNQYITCVGGTSLTTDSAGGPWSSEIGWNGSGGGISRTFVTPGWQSGISNTSNQASTKYRNIPDVAATAAFQFYFVYNNGSNGGIGGTSGSAPLWAGFTALINQQAAAYGKPGAGFINPAIYSEGKGSDYDPDFHDITSGNNFNIKSPDKFSTAPGYDLVTGWGTPNGIYTINALAGITLPDFSLSAQQQNVTVNQGSINTFPIAVKSINGFRGDVSLSVSGLPSGVTASFASSNSSNSISMTLTANYSANTGTTTIRITGTSDSLSHVILVGLTVNAAPTATTQTNLLHYFSRVGIVADSSKFSGGLDGVGYAYSGRLLGTSINWNNTSFNLGSPNTPDVVSAIGQTITLPSGKFASLRMLAAAVNGNQTSQKFMVTYSDSSATMMQSFSDWFSPANFAGENIAVTMLYRNTAAGGKDNNTFYLYGYAFRLDPAKTIRTITLPNDQNVEILAMTLAAPVTDTALSVNTFRLDQNYPNPFNPFTTIHYNLPTASVVTLKVYDILGREVQTLVSGLQAAGPHEVLFYGNRFASGVYFCRLQAGPFVSIKKLVLIK